MSDKNINEVMGVMGWLCVGLTLLFVGFLAFGGRMLPNDSAPNGLAPDIDTSAIGTPGDCTLVSSKEGVRQYDCPETRL